MEALCLERSLGGTAELLFSISTQSELVLHPDIQLAGENMGRGQQETGQRLGNLLDEARPGEQGCPAQGGGGGWERAKVSQVRTAKQCCHQLSSGTHLCPGSPWKLPSRLTSQPAAELHSGAGEMEVKAEPWSLWLRCDRARDTPRDGVEQPSISSEGDMVQGKDVTFSPCCPLAVLVTGISPLGSPSTREGLWNTDPLPARNHLVLLVAPRTSFEE